MCRILVVPAQVAAMVGRENKGSVLGGIVAGGAGKNTTLYWVL